MDDQEIVRRISELAGGEHDLEQAHAGMGLAADELTRQRVIEVFLDQCWAYSSMRVRLAARGELISSLKEHG